MRLPDNLPRSLGDVAAALGPGVDGLRPLRGLARSGTQPRTAVVEFGGAPVHQIDETTCGSAALLVLAASGDPTLARWLADGTLPDDVGLAGLPPEIPRPALAQPLDAAGRIAAVQRHIKARTSARAVCGLPWPGAWGTPPWTAAREARFPGVRYAARAVDDRGERGRQMAALVLGALDRGKPVLLFTGGALSSGVRTALPRHVVLAVPTPTPLSAPDGDALLSIYEPATARVHQVPARHLVDRRTPSPALGGWSHVQWLALPYPAAPARP